MSHAPPRVRHKKIIVERVMSFPDLTDLFICGLCGYSMVVLYNARGVHCPICERECTCGDCMEQWRRWSVARKILFPERVRFDYDWGR